MPIIDKCAKCGSSSVIPRARVLALYQGDRELHARVDADPTATVFKKAVRSPVHAWICGQCGYVEMYADNPSELYKAFIAAQSTMTRLG